jgi:hypothetical protein
VTNTTRILQTWQSSEVSDVMCFFNDRKQIYLKIDVAVFVQSSERVNIVLLMLSRFIKWKRKGHVYYCLVWIHGGMSAANQWAFVYKLHSYCLQSRNELFCRKELSVTVSLEYGLHILNTVPALLKSVQVKPTSKITVNLQKVTVSCGVRNRTKQ